jgi:hypothetical protein
VLFVEHGIVACPNPTHRLRLLLLPKLVTATSHALGSPPDHTTLSVDSAGWKTAMRPPRKPPSRAGSPVRPRDRGPFFDDDAPGAGDLPPQHRAVVELATNEPPRKYPYFVHVQCRAGRWHPIFVVARPSRYLPVRVEFLSRQRRHPLVSRFRRFPFLVIQPRSPAASRSADAAPTSCAGRRAEQRPRR